MTKQEDEHLRMVAESFLIEGVHPNLKLVSEAALESLSLVKILRDLSKDGVFAWCRQAPVSDHCGKCSTCQAVEYLWALNNPGKVHP